MKRILSVITAGLMAVLFAGALARAGLITPDLYETLQKSNPVDEVSVIITLSDQVDLKSFKDKDKKLRRTRILKALKLKAEKNQNKIKKFLEENKAKKIKSFWIFNGLAATIKVEAVKKIASMTEVASVSLNATLSLPEPQVSTGTGEPEWNINMIRAPEMWDLGYDGNGIVVASMDTGVDATHQDLAAKWRGGANSWYDLFGDSTIPYDYSGHGTGVMGILVGGDAGGSAIGVAPGAQWIAVKLFSDAGQSTDENIHLGFQWLLDPDGDSETDDAPDVVNNSWTFQGYPHICNDKFQQDIQALKSANIAVVFAAGNGGPNLNTDESPGNNLNGFATGAVDVNQDIAYFSARGPSACDGTTFPEVVAPGIGIHTVDLGNSYIDNAEGTSFAAPHISGAMGLLLQADPSLSIDEIESALTASAIDLGIPGPDNVYGYGRLDVLAAAQALNLVPPNIAPVANNDIATTPRNLAISIDILANDLDPDGTIDPASVTLRLGTTTLQGATVTIDSGTGVIIYDPAGTGGGPDYFWYTVADTLGATSNEARVRINRVRSSDGNQTVTPSSFRDRTR